MDAVAQRPRLAAGAGGGLGGAAFALLLQAALDWQERPLPIAQPCTALLLTGRARLPLEGAGGQLGPAPVPAAGRGPRSFSLWRGGRVVVIFDVADSGTVAPIAAASHPRDDAVDGDDDAPICCCDGGR